MDDRRSRDHRDRIPYDLSTDRVVDWHTRRQDSDRQSAGDVTPTRFSYADPDTAATPVSEWSEDGSEISRGSSEYEFDTAAARAKFGSTAYIDADSPSDDLSISASLSALTIRETDLSFESDVATVRQTSVANSQYSSASQGSATSQRYQGMFHVFYHVNLCKKGLLI